MNLLICVDNIGYEASLETRKIYRRVDDSRAADLGLVRVVDESGEDYLYATDLFQTIPFAAPLEELDASNVAIARLSGIKRRS